MHKFNSEMGCGIEFKNSGIYILFSESDHKILEYSLLEFAEELLRTKQIRFVNGKYINNI